MLELEHELRCAPDSEFEDEFELEDEFEGEEFIGDLWRWARGAYNWATTPGSTQRRVALGAAKTALRSGMSALGKSLGTRYAGTTGSSVGDVIGSTIGGGLAAWLPDQEYEYFGDGEFEDEGESPAQTAALMEHLAARACTTRSDKEAEAFIGALVPLAAKLLPSAASAITRAAPGLIRGVTSMVSNLRRNPATRPLVRTAGTIVRRTAADVARNVARGKPVTPKTAVRTLAKQTARTLSNRTATAQALRRCRALNRRYALALRRASRTR